MATREEKLGLIKQLTTQIEIVADSIDEETAAKTAAVAGSDVALSTLYLSDVMKKQNLKGKEDLGDDKQLDDMIENLNRELADLKKQLGGKGKKRKK